MQTNLLILSAAKCPIRALEYHSGELTTGDNKQRPYI